MKIFLKRRIVSKKYFNFLIYFRFVFLPVELFLPNHPLSVGVFRKRCFVVGYGLSGNYRGIHIHFAHIIHEITVPQNPYLDRYFPEKHSACTIMFGSFHLRTMWWNIIIIYLIMILRSIKIIYRNTFGNYIHESYTMIIWVTLKNNIINKRHLINWWLHFNFRGNCKQNTIMHFFLFRYTTYLIFWAFLSMQIYHRNYNRGVLFILW